MRGSWERGVRNGEWNRAAIAFIWPRSVSGVFQGEGVPLTRGWAYLQH
jgi:hypothetical protein